MKSYTDLEQSKTLAEILPLESADMHSEAKDINGDMVFIVVSGLGDKTKSNYGSPIWSLAALLNAVPQIKVRGSKKIGYVVYYNKDITSNRRFDIVDACYEMILKLHELKML